MIFFSIFLTVFGLINFYIFIRGLHSIPENCSLRSSYAIVFWVVALSFMGGRVLENVLTSTLSDILVWVGSLWIAGMLYLFLAVCLLDLLRLINDFLPLFPSFIEENYTQAKYVTSVSVMGLVSLVVLAGYVNAASPKVTTLNLSVNKKIDGVNTLNLVAVSDIHLGTIVGRARLNQIVSRINSLDPDLVLLPGDIVDEDLSPVIRQNLGEALKRLNSRLGVFGITGNHEYIGGVERACSYLSDHNVTMLRDETIKVANAFYLVGREDRSFERFTGRKRKELAELMASVDSRLPIIMMDHQPFRLEEAVDSGVDLQLSGHTHNGQLWPLNYIVDSIYELAWGYKRIGKTHIYVSNGVGTWGPPVRTGNRPEIMQIKLHFEPGADPQSNGDYAEKEHTS